MKCLIDARRERGIVTSNEFLVLASVHAPNFIQGFIKGDCDYPYSLQLNSPQAWETVYDDIYKNHMDVYIDKLIHNHIHTNNINRGNSISFMTHRVFGENKISYAECGSAANQIPTRVVCDGACSEQDPYIIHSDSTSYNGQAGLIKASAERPVPVGYVVGLDLVDQFATPQSQAWFMFCDHIKNMNPEHLSKKTRRMHDYRSIDNVHFVQADMCNPPLPDASLNLITYPTTLYQLSKEKRDIALEAGRSCLLPGGIQAVWDYHTVDPFGNLELTKRRADYDYGLVVRGDVTEGRWMSVLRFRTSECKEIIPSEHFNQFMMVTEATAR